MNTSAYSRRGVPTTGVMVIAFVPPANAGIGRDMDSLFVISSSSCSIRSTDKAALAILPEIPVRKWLA
jgi:hypothetical protein